MAEWQIERGIGEDRALLIDANTILKARQHWHGELLAGTVIAATLIAKTAGDRRGTARLNNGMELLVDRLPSNAQEGASMRVEITRSPIRERGRLKMAHARPTDRPATMPKLADSLARTHYSVREVRRFTAPGWNDLLDDSLAQAVSFSGGTLLFSPTPAMLMIDIDGALAPRDLSLAAVPAIADALRQFDIGGMIGVDFPTLATKQHRRAVDDALGRALDNWPHERTAMNGFGFVQIVSRLEHPSLIHRAATARTGLLVRRLLRQAEHSEESGAILLTIHPALRKQLKPEWLDELTRRTGRNVRIEVDPALAPEGSFAQSVPL